MKKKVYLVSLIAVVLCSSLCAQSSPKNLLQFKTNLYYFKGLDIRFKPLNYFPLNLVYSRYIKDKPYFIGANFYHYRYSDHNHPELKERGDVQAKFFIVVGLHAGYRLPITSKRTFLAKFGLAYRMGRRISFTP
ncbi:MAG: hypothetical protein K9J37_04015 [Saprospiraceae bacterium]|nr:hypothetical protein [Saprospiraceae bacterium]MCF8249051.1 hypothetical protein [Saprospiraceae bacterium]MCF8282722.1 hypothetical protein [Bacteroidales bacterium]MCF8311073.1 hypothetical protein [Saprospiraceae bacterium]MCF8443082.1 hypothetical protein [Saprospiraceae bacterium]